MFVEVESLPHRLTASGREPFCFQALRWTMDHQHGESPSPVEARTQRVVAPGAAGIRRARQHAQSSPGMNNWDGFSRIP